MSRKGLLPLSICFFLACLISIKARADESVKVMPQIRLEDTIHGISFSKRHRFVIKDIRVGDTSVRDLFWSSDSPLISGRDYYSWRPENVTIMLRDKGLLSRLKYISLTNEAPSLIIDLVDPRKDGALRWIREKASIVLGPGFSVQLKYPIEINVPLCERVTQVIFYGIDSQLQQEVTKGQAETSISLDRLFQLLREDRLDSFIRRLGPIAKMCPDAVRLLKWIRNEEVYGFEFKRYAVTPELGSVLIAISKSVSRFQGWQRHNFRISVVGYTDPTAVQDPEKSNFLLQPARTGVKSLSLMSSIRVYYRGCDGDHISGSPQYIEFSSPAGRLVRSPIETNCELGAVRAFAATAFLAEKLGRTNVEYEYATGGVAPTGDADELKRKIDLNIVVRAATQ